LTSKPTWFSTFWVLSYVGFFVFGVFGHRPMARNGRNAGEGSVRMAESRPTMSREIAEVVIACQQETNRHPPKAVTVVLSQDTLVVMLHEAVAPVEKDLAKSPSGAALVQTFHRQIFAISSPRLRMAIQRITGVEWREAVQEVEPVTGAAVLAFTRSDEVQITCLAPGVPRNSPSGCGSGD
jgi:uncharacterized protein YbcI